MAKLAYITKDRGPLGFRCILHHIRLGAGPEFKCYRVYRVALDELQYPNICLCLIEIEENTPTNDSQLQAYCRRIAG